jgi:hypothetical protein
MWSLVHCVSSFVSMDQVHSTCSVKCVISLAIGQDANQLAAEILRRNECHLDPGETDVRFSLLP